MIGRAIGLLLLVMTAGAWGWGRGSASWTLAGALLGALLWMRWDSVRAGQLLRWLSRTDAIQVPRLRGLWGELLERSRKRFRALEQKAQGSEDRLQDFLAALQASPIRPNATAKGVTITHFSAASRIGPSR